MRSERGAVNKIVILGVLFTAAILLLVLYSTMGNAKYRCEVCVSYQGRQACRTASAATQEQAERTAKENACAQIASGVTDSIACDNSTPISVIWLTHR
jgi:hypothetical protein